MTTCSLKWHLHVICQEFHASFLTAWPHVARSVSYPLTGSVRCPRNITLATVVQVTVKGFFESAVSLNLARLKLRFPLKECTSPRSKVSKQGVSISCGQYNSGVKLLTPSAHKAPATYALGEQTPCLHSRYHSYRSVRQSLGKTSTQQI